MVIAESVPIGTKTGALFRRRVHLLALTHADSGRHVSKSLCCLDWMGSLTSSIHVTASGLNKSESPIDDSLSEMSLSTVLEFACVSSSVSDWKDCSIRFDDVGSLLVSHLCDLTTSAHERLDTNGETLGISSSPGGAASTDIEHSGLVTNFITITVENPMIW